MLKIRKLLLQSRRFASQLINESHLIEKESPHEFILDKTQSQQTIEKNPQLSAIAQDIWYRSHDTFSNHGVTTNNFLEIVSKYPEILSRNPKLITESLELWRCCQFEEKYLFQLITKYPMLLNISASDGRNLMKRIAYLRSHVSSIKKVWKLIMNCPNIITDNENVIEQKFNYLKNVMRIDVPEICKSTVFNKSLEEIKCRHILLERLNLFKPRSLKAEPHEKTKNPRLYEIVDTTDLYFSTKIASINQIEYETFKLLFKRELEKSADENSDDSYSDDE